MIPDRKPRFKVVKRKSRCSAVIHGGSKYGLKYLPETYVYAPEGTLGIFTFKSEYSAKQWTMMWSVFHTFSDEVTKDLIVIPVIPLSRGKAVRHCSQYVDTEGLDEFYDDMTYCGACAETPSDTFAYPGVFVLA